MLETKTEAKRRVRDAKIIDLYHIYRIDGKAKREVSSEKIAKECKTSVTTVKRVTKLVEEAYQLLRIVELPNA